MKLLRAVAKLESGAAAAREAEPTEVGICWTRCEKRVDAEQLRAGEYIAADRYLESGDDGAAIARVVERVTKYSWDLGWIYDLAGERIGRVVAMEGSLVDWERL